MSKKGFRIAMSILAAVIVALIGLNMTTAEDEGFDVSYQMANAHISWEQSFYGGPWNH